MYLYRLLGNRAVDSNGNIVEFMLSPTRDATSASYPMGAFFRKALSARHDAKGTYCVPRKLNVNVLLILFP